MRSLIFMVILCYALTYVSSSNSSYPLIRRQINVPVGRRIFLQPSDLGVNVGSSGNESCVVELTLGEAITQKVGRFQPEVFNCLFANKSVFYSHFGSHMLKFDVIRLRVYRYNSEPEIEEIEITFHIQFNVPYKTVTVLNHLNVPGFFGVSQPVDDRVLRFASSTCRVIVRLSIIGPKWPKYGQIIYGQNRTVLDAPLEESCEVFPYLNLRYEHLSPPTPEVDYIDLLIESPQPDCSTCIQYEWIQLKVVIKHAKSNLPPNLSDHSSLQISSVIYQPETVTSKILWAEDNETASANILYNITQRPKHGYFHFISNQNTPLYSFLQRDIIDHRVAFTGTKVGGENISIGVFDEFFLPARHQINLAISISDATDRQVFIANGIIVFEGQSVTVTSKNIQLAASKTKEQPRVSFQVLSGPRYGALKVDQRSSVKFFYWYDVEWGALTYTHDGSDTSADEILLMAGQQKLRLPITVVAVDDSPPQLVVNSGLTVEEGRTLIITADHLKAVDPDTTNEEIYYQVIHPPQAGYLLKKLRFRSGFVQVTNFTQNEIDNELIVYTHANAKLYLDEFQVVLSESNLLTPNYSPAYDVSVVIQPLANDPPRPMVTSSFRAVVREVDALFINRNILGFINKEARDDGIYYNFTSGSPSTEGKFVLSANVGTKDQLQHLPVVTYFSQQQVNRRQVVYVPPVNDIGPNIMEVHLKFSVIDGYGNIAPNNEFHVTVLPFDNKKPLIVLGNVTVGRGQKCYISWDFIKVVDEDTEEDDIVLQIKSKPTQGRIMLDDAPLLVSQSFTIKDIKESRLTYIHRGHNLGSESVTISAMDGRNQTTFDVLKINVHPVDKNSQMVEQPEFSDQMTVSVMEKDLITIPIELLTSDVELNETNVHYAVVKTPHHGSVYVRGNRRDVFSQNELANGEVQYIHDGNEIGRHPQLDDMWITINDGQTRGRSGGDPVQTLKINIIPVDNVAPKLRVAQSLQLIESGSTRITQENLIIEDDDSNPEHIVLVVVKAPLYGAVMLDGKKTKHFRLDQMLNGLVSYTQTNHRWLEQRWDSMVVYATDGHHRSDSVKIDANITLINDEPPHVMAKSFSVPQMGSKILDKSVFVVTDLDWPPDQITISLTNPPLFGRLTIANNSPRAISFFSKLSLGDWEKASVQYTHTATHLTSDRFTLSVSDGLHQVWATFTVNVTEVPTTQKKVTESVKLEINSPETLEEFTDGVYGFIFTRHNFKIRSEHEDVLFKITSKPVNGRLDNILTGRKDVSSFQLKDILNEHLRYVILNAKGGNDSFTFTLDIPNETYKMNLEWSVIYFQKSTMKVCEDVGVMSVTVLRSSNLAKPAFVNIRAQSETALEPFDYRPSRVRQLQFNSGVSSLNWEINIVDDEPDKDLVETFTILLSGSVNAIVLTDNSTLVIQIVDQRRGGCGKGSEEPSTTALTDTVTNPQDCTKANAGQKLIINYGPTKISLICDGSAWKPTN